MTLDRRELLRRAVAGAAAVAFFPGSRHWVAEGAEPPPGSVPVPELDGELILEGEVLDQAADDFGHLVSRQPFAVLRPGSVRDIVKMVRFARAQDLQVAGMGAVGDSHSTFGQAQAEAGVVIDMATLDTIHQVGPDSVVADAGASWLQVLEATLPFGKSPPTLTDYLGLRVGGTLSVGGIGGQAFRSGFQTDNVLALQVVTGRGQLVTCSPRRRPVLFHAVRAGLGQFAVIVRVRLRLVDVPPETRTYTALYGDLETFTGDQERLLRDRRFDYVEGQAVPADGGGWLFLLEAARYFDPAAPPDDGALTGDLSFLPGTLATEDRSYIDFANRLAPIVELLIQLGIWALPHPWLNLFVPGPEAVPFLRSVLDEETPGTTGQGPVLIYPCRRSRVTAPFLTLPDSRVFYLLSILRNAIPPIDPQDQVARNREIYDRVAAIGGKRYPIGSVPFSRADWRRHFGRRFPLFALAKRVFDPANILTPGQGIFGS